MIEDNTGKKTIKAGFWYIICNMLSKGLVFLVTPIFTRLLTTEQFGIYTNFTTWQSVFLIIATLQLSSTISVAWRDFHYDIDGYISTIALLGTFVTIGEFTIITLKRSFFEELLSIDYTYILILFVYLAFAPALQIILTKSQFKLEYKKTTVLTVLFSFTSTGLAILSCYLFNDRLFGRIVGYEGTLILLNAILYIQIIITGKKFSFRYCKYALRIGFPLTIHLLAGNILASCDKIVIEKTCGYDDLALYGLGFTCAMAARVLWESTNQAIVPWFFEKLDKNDSEEIKKVTKQYVIIFFFVLIGFTLFCPELVLLFGGRQYLQAMYVIPPIIIAIGFQLLYSLYANVETYYKKTSAIAIGTTVSALINIVLNIVFIPKYGYVAAAYTTVVCYVCLCFFHYINVKALRKTYLFDNKRLAIYGTLLAVCALLCLLLYKHPMLRFVVIGIFSCIVVIYALKRKGKLYSLVRMLLGRM